MLSVLNGLFYFYREIKKDCSSDESYPGQIYRSRDIVSRPKICRGYRFQPRSSRILRFCPYRLKNTCMLCINILCLLIAPVSPRNFIKLYQGLLFRDKKSKSKCVALTNNMRVYCLILINTVNDIICCRILIRVYCMQKLSKY